ncbi:MAG: hypothetical protein K8L91_26580 [Anaerolineae bacterium]|nr:hypothetical protein [Anaerolineae bacterium]
MKRLLGLTTGLMGLCLLVTLAGLARIRSRSESPTLMLVAVGDDNPANPRTLYLAAFGSPHHQKLLTGYPDYTRREWSPDGRWYYFTASDDIGEFAEEAVWRIERDGRTIERLVGMEYPTHAVWMSDSSGLLIPIRHDLLHVNPATQVAESLTPTFGLQIKTYEGCTIQASPEAVYFCAGTLASDRRDLYRLHPDGQLENLTADLYWPTGILAHAADWEWMIAHSAGQLYSIEPNQSELQPLFTEWVIDDSISNVKWIPSADVLVVETDTDGQYTLYGFDMTTRRLVWQKPAMRLVEVTGDDWLVISANPRTFFRMRPAGTALAEIIALDEDERYFAVSPDGAWLLYTRVDVGTYTYEVWRVPLLGGRPQMNLHISSSTTFVDLIGWSYDQAWMLLDYRQGLRQEQRWLRVNGTATRPLVEWGDARFLDWFGPLDRDWQPLGLMGIGAVLIGVCVVLARPKKSA